MKMRGGLTVFLALLLGLVLAVVFGFLEAARVSGLRANAGMQSMQAADSLLSEYHAGLWKDYDILLWEAPGGEAGLAAARQKYYLAHNTDSAVSVPLMREYPFLEIAAADITVDAFEYATDQNGMPFRTQAVLAAKNGLAKASVSELEEVFAQSREPDMTEADIRRMETESESLQERLEDPEMTAEANAAVETEHAQDVKEQTESFADTESPGALQRQKLKKDNPVKWMLRVRKEGVLALVMQDKPLSDKKLEQSELLSARKRNQGNYEGVKQSSAADRIWYQLYLQQHFSDASGETGDGALDYEMEYLLAGKSRDTDNLKAAVNRLLLLREGANYLYLLHDQEKSEEALLLATAIASAFGQPELAEAVRHAVLLAWAYAESVCDVRTLLDGGKVAPVKTKEQWRTGLDNLSGGYRGENGDGQGEEKGLTYTQYLQLLLLSQKEERITYRAMDLIEQKEAIRMDQMVSRMKCSYRFEAKPLFWRFVTLGENSLNGLSFQTERQISYYEE